MKKRFLTIAIAAGLAAPLMASAGDATVYGRVHVSLDSIEVGTADAELDLADRKSAFGVKGKEDLGGGLTALYKVEWSFGPTDGAAIGTRDRWLGLKKAGMGTFKFGTMSNNYKQTMGKMDPFWHTAVEGRGILNGTSTLTNKSGDDDGRMTNLFQFNMAPMGGIGFVFNVQLNGSGDMTQGIGIRYKAKNLFVFADTLKINNDADNNGFSDDAGYAAGESATKFGGKYTMGALTAGITLEQSEDLVSFDYTTLMATYKLNDNDTVALTYGMAEHVTTAALDSDALAVGYMHKMSKRTMAYVAYGDTSSDTAASEVNGFSLGLRHSF